MSEFHVEVVRIGKVRKHEGADTLSITNVHDDKGLGYPCIFRTGQFQEGDLAIYIPVDALVDGSRPEFEFLGPGQHRIKAKKLRGVFSLGLLAEIPPYDQFVGIKPGENMQEYLGITKYEPPLSYAGFHTPQDKTPRGPLIPNYDLEGLPRHGDLLTVGEEVVLTEKIHGASARFFYASDEQKLFVGSRTTWKLEDSDKLWWPAFRSAGLSVEALKAMPDMVFYGEVFGQVQDLKYGHPGKTSPAWLRCFDVFNRKENRFLDYAEALLAMRAVGVAPVPEFYRGPWSPDLVAQAEGQSTFANHVREGFVVRPLVERPASADGLTPRVVLKQVGQGYHLRKSA